MKEIRQTKLYVNYLKTQGWKIEKINSDFVFIKKIPPLGSMIKYQRPENPDLKKLLKLAKKYRGFYIVVELKNDSEINSFLKNNFKVIKPFLPSKTLILDIKKDKEIYKSFSKDARYAIRKTETNTIKEEKDVQIFQKNWATAAARGRYILSVKQLKDYKNAFGENMMLLTNKSGSSGAMFLMADGVGYYWYGYTSNAARATLIQYRIIYEGIKWAKSKGAKKFDFEGIYDERFPNNDWLGFTKFKKKFGGKELEYPASMAKWKIKNIFNF